MQRVSGGRGSTGGVGTGKRGVIEWCHDPVLKALRQEPPPRRLGWDALIMALTGVDCRMVETPGFHLSVECRGRVARFQHAIGDARGYQLRALRVFLEDTA